MTKKQIIVDILDTGEVKISTVGFKGRSCTLESEWIEKILGEVQARRLLPVYFEKDGQTVRKYLNLCG